MRLSFRWNDLKKHDNDWEILEIKIIIIFLLYMTIVLNPRFKSKYVKFCPNSLNDVEELKELTSKINDTFVRLSK